MNTYKNSIAVVTPGTSFMGVLEPTCVGAFYGDADLGLEVLKSMKDPDEAFIREFAKQHAEVAIKWDYHGMGIYIDVEVETENGTGRVVVAQAHDRVVLREVNGKVLYQDPKFDLNDQAFDGRAPIRDYCVRDFYDFAREVPLEDIAFLNEAVELNTSLAKTGLAEKMGSAFGDSIAKLAGEPGYIRAKSLAAAASDARMSGANLSAMSCAKSGNVGIAASVPLVALAEEAGKTREELLRAVCLSYLMTIYLKSHIGRLSAMCACAIAASLGTGAGYCLLLGLDYSCVEKTVSNIVGSIGGTLCDGAKFGCAMKLATAAGVAIESARLAQLGSAIPDGDGLVCYSADDTIAMLGRIAAPGMVSANEFMAHEIITRENARS
ncbi:MAG: serine dehydratase subunit alpha family protein [Oscillospiraceae bacterium]